MKRTPRKRGKRPKRKSAHQELVDQADAWNRALAIKRYGEACLLAHIKSISCGGGLQGAHILRKGGQYRSIRWHEDNLLPICRNHHIFWAHQNEHDFDEWVEATFPGRIANLKKIAREIGGKVDVKALICVMRHAYNSYS